MSRKILAVLVIGVASFFVWSAGFSAAYYRLYLLAGAPEHLPKFVGILSIALLSLVFGAVGALPTRLIVVRPRLKAAAIFLGGGSLCFFASVTYFTGVVGVIDQLSSYGFWGFILGALVVLCGGARSTQPRAPADPRSARPAER